MDWGVGISPVEPPFYGCDSCLQESKVPRLVVPDFYIAPIPIPYAVITTVVGDGEEGHSPLDGGVKNGGSKEGGSKEGGDKDKRSRVVTSSSFQIGSLSNTGSGIGTGGSGQGPRRGSEGTGSSNSFIVNNSSSSNSNSVMTELVRPEFTLYTRRPSGTNNDMGQRPTSANKALKQVRVRGLIFS